MKYISYLKKVFTAYLFILLGSGSTLIIANRAIVETLPEYKNDLNGLTLFLFLATGGIWLLVIGAVFALPYLFAEIKELLGKFNSLKKSV